VLDLGRILAVLPHGHPMVLVDRVESLEPGASIVGLKAITCGEPCYRDLPAGLAPERYAYPASLIVESFGQTAALLWHHSVESLHLGSGRVLLFAVARDCRIEGRAFPGEVLRHLVRLDQVVGDHVFVSGETRVEDRRLATIGSMMATVRTRSAVLAASSRALEPQGDRPT
jgi:3-hydroxyacyl-[acyl-carrier-protein] dehydratase